MAQVSPFSLVETFWYFRTVWAILSIDSVRNFCTLFPKRGMIIGHLGVP